MVTKLLERMGGADKPVLNRGDKSPLPIFKKRSLRLAEITWYNVRKRCGDFLCATFINIKTGPSFGGIPPNWRQSLKRLPFRRGSSRADLPQLALPFKARLSARRFPLKV